VPGAADSRLRRSPRPTLFWPLLLSGIALAGCGTSHDSDLDWGPWSFDENIVGAVRDARDSVSAARLASFIDCLSIKQIQDAEFRRIRVRDWMTAPDTYSTRDRSQIARIITGLSSDGRENGSSGLRREKLHTLVLLYDRTLLRYACIYAMETNDPVHWILTSAQETGAWSAASVDSTLISLGAVHSAR